MRIPVINDNFLQTVYNWRFQASVQYLDVGQLEHDIQLHFA